MPQAGGQRDKHELGMASPLEVTRVLRMLEEDSANHSTMVCARIGVSTSYRVTKESMPMHGWAEGILLW